MFSAQFWSTSSDHHMAMGDVHTQFEWPLGLSHHTRLQYTVHIRLFGWPEKFAWQSLFELLVAASVVVKLIVRVSIHRLYTTWSIHRWDIILYNHHQQRYGWPFAVHESYVSMCKWSIAFVLINACTVRSEKWSEVKQYVDWIAMIRIEWSVVWISWSSSCICLIEWAKHMIWPTHLRRQCAATSTPHIQSELWPSIGKLAARIFMLFTFMGPSSPVFALVIDCP